jgi:hypothetical protein
MIEANANIECRRRLPSVRLPSREPIDYPIYMSKGSVTLYTGKAFLLCRVSSRPIDNMAFVLCC